MALCGWVSPLIEESGGAVVAGGLCDTLGTGRGRVGVEICVNGHR